MIEIDFNRCRPVVLPDGSLSYIKEHAKIGVKAIVKSKFFGLLDEMGGMKTAQSIVAAQFLFDGGEIDQAIVIAPNAVRPVWFDPEIGELSKQLFLDIRAKVFEIHAKTRYWEWNPELPKKAMNWFITNYEFIRSERRLGELLEFCTKRTMLILDESSSIKNWKSEQTKSVMDVRKQCGITVILNGTPVAHSPMDMYSQGMVLNPEILAAPSARFPERPKRYTFFVFRSRYAIMGGYLGKQTVAWQNIDDLQERFAPHVLRRLKKDCLDLPKALPPVPLYVPLSPETWKIYKEMKEEMVAWLQSSAAIASHPAIKSLRLAQITSGIVGGVQDLPEFDENNPEPQEAKFGVEFQTKEISTEKQDFFFNWLDERLSEDPKFKLVVWCRFIPELERLIRELSKRYPKVLLGSCAGKSMFNRKIKEERDEALRLLNPHTTPDEPVIVAGTYGTGSLGLNFTAAHTMINLSSDYAYWKDEQAKARIDRPGQIHTTSFFDIVATGPAGQKTIDHMILKARINKEDIATWTTERWVKGLTEE